MQITNSPENISQFENSKASYIDLENWLAIFFKNYIRENSLLRKYPSFFTQYKLLRPFHKMIFPFNYINKGDICVQVGCAEWMFDFGVSMALIMSAIVGKKGRVIVVEPDQRNIDALNAYTKKHNIKNITVVKKAAWKEKGVNNFTFYEDRSSTNVVTEVEDEASWRDKAEYQGRKKRLEKIEMDTIDNIAREFNIKPDFVNLTINGAEFDVIKGMTESIKNGVKVSWLFGDRWWWRDGINNFSDKNYDVIVSNSAYSHRGPTINGKVKVHPYKEFKGLFDVMHAIAIPQDIHIKDSREFSAIIYKRKDFDFIVKPVK